MKPCKVCKTPYIQRNSLQTVCSPNCAIKWSQSKAGKKHAQKAHRADFREFKESAKSKADWMKEAQIEVNKFVRLRDKGLPCISCGINYGQMQAGHYRSRGACPALRFEMSNIHAQCAQCNGSKSGNIVEYRINLVKKLGADKVDWLEGPHEPKRYTIEDLKGIKAEYKAKIIGANE